MAKIKEMYASRPEMSEMEKKQAQLTIKCADMIKSSIKISALMQQAVHMEPQDIFASLTMAVGDFMVAMAQESRESRKELVTQWTKLLKDYVMNAEEEKGDQKFS